MLPSDQCEQPHRRIKYQQSYGQINDVVPRWSIFVVDIWRHQVWSNEVAKFANAPILTAINNGASPVSWTYDRPDGDRACRSGCVCLSRQLDGGTPTIHVGRDCIDLIAGCA